ncbi:MAG: glycosyltransferase family 4 protein [Candidatus Peregrinibacteria bacterium]|nr:glycosyltransferase family 4 protein [Candidatus Peregrinibacteria bacterium]
MKPLKILIFAGYYHPFRGGYVESIHGLSKGLVEKGHTVTIVTSNIYGDSTKDIMDGVRIVRLPSWHILNKTFPVAKPSLKTWRLLRELSKEGYDVVSTQTRFFVTSFYGACFALFKRLPLVHTERGAYHSVVTNKLIDWTSRAIDHTLGMMVVRIAKRNVGVSNAAAEFLKHLWARNVSRIPNGIDLIDKVNESKKNELKKKWELSPDDYVLLFVGRLIYGKGLQDVFPLVKDLVAVKPNLKLVVVAGGLYREELEKMIKDLGIGKYVKFLGLLQGDEVIESLQMADAFVNPSHSEGLPRSVLEAAAAGLPIVASDVGGTNEIVEHEKTGLLFEAQDIETMGKHLTAVLKDEAYATGLGMTARERIKTSFGWPKIVADYEELFYQTK